MQGEDQNLDSVELDKDRLRARPGIAGPFHDGASKAFRPPFNRCGQVPDRFA
jgi:hypothetical protein